ncbi:MAG: hypothetical protein ABWW69_06960 [Pyrodictiaceae archaeon]
MARIRKDEVLNFIERRIENANQWIRAAFYSDPDVVAILDKLYERWYKSSQEGEPIDYANDEELRMLFDAAKRYARMSPYEAYALVSRRMEERE